MLTSVYKAEPIERGAITMMPMPRRKEDERRLCCTCGADITRYTGRTQCSLCEASTSRVYWKGRLEKSPPLETLLKERGDLKQRKRQAEEAQESAEVEMWKRERSLKANAPRWKKFLGIDYADDRLVELRLHAQKLRQEVYQLESELERVESSIQTVRHVRKSFESAVQREAFERRRKEEAQQRKREFEERSSKASGESYNRSMFKIRQKDYKRGNPLDNHFRNQFLEQALGAFDCKCLFCGSTHDLTLDHFGIPKNEGGNFILVLQDGSGIRMNLIVLCRSCNAAKGELAYDEFFDEVKAHEAMIHQTLLLNLVLSHDATIEIIESWYGIRIQREIPYWFPTDPSK